MSGNGRAPSRGSRRAWGWHPLSDGWARRLVDEAQVRPGDLVLDVGAGDGALTRHLVAAGARVIALELHPGRAATLRERFTDAGVVVVQADARDLLLPHRPFRVVASPPYAVTSDLVRRLLAPGSRLVDARLVLQRAAAERLAAGRASGAGRWARHWEVEVGRPVPRTAFRPPPRVDSVVLEVRRRGSR